MLPPIPLITVDQFSRLLENGLRTSVGEEIDPIPVVKLFTPDCGCTWLLTEVNPKNKGLFFGLCDLGHGVPELGFVSLDEIKSVRGPSKMPVERDIFFKAEHPLSWYTKLAHQAKKIVYTEK